MPTTSLRIRASTHHSVIDVRTAIQSSYSCHTVGQNRARQPRMHIILNKQQLSPNVTRLDVEAPRIAEIRQPRQFVIVRLGAEAERIPLTIADANQTAGAITLVVQSVGKSTRDLVA